MDFDFAARASRLAVLVVVSWLVAVPASGGEPPAVEFLSPRPGAAMILPETNIIVRPGGVVTESGSECLRATGSVSGSHAGTLRLSDDRRTVTFQPDLPFVASETVTCRLETGLSTDTRGPVAPGVFSFTIAGPEREALRDQPAPSDVDEDPRALASGSAPAGNASSAAPAESLPFDFPAIHADVPGVPAPGRLFLTDIFFNIRGPRIPSYLMILENDGTPYWYRRIDGVGLDFKMQPDGRLTYFDSAHDAFYAMDARYAVVDSFRCGNGYSTDNHDLLLLPNGHAVLMSADPQILDLSAIGGYPNAVVIGLIIQELDQEKNVVFQWRSWDHFQITDMIFHRIDVPLVDYVHGNSIDVDPEGNFILSSRHMNEVTKISRATGEILWRLGGKNNQFRFVNEPIAFSHQHHVRLLPDGHLTMFDNGNFRLPPFSRAVEYAIDETNRTATLVWQYRLTPDVFGVAFGSVQRLGNGNTLIGWGATQPTLTEVDPAGRIVSRLTFDSGVASYRAFRFEWPPVKPAAIAFDPSTVALDPATGQDPERGTIRARIAPVDSDFAVADIIVPSVRLGGSVPADTTTAQADRDGLVLLFARTGVEPLLGPGTHRLEVSGSLTTGERFRGFGSIEAVGTGARRDPGAPPKLVSAPGRLPVELVTTGVSGKRQSFAVYDIHGRLVRRGQVPAGAARVSWDGRDRDGRPAASGVYLIRVEDGSPRTAAKVAIIR
jgi:hypothetical protein